jgi:hypothetical protein
VFEANGQRWLQGHERDGTRVPWTAAAPMHLDIEGVSTSWVLGDVSGRPCRWRPTLEQPIFICRPMPDDSNPTNADIIAALQGMWRQQQDLVQGVERRLGGKVDGAVQRLHLELEATEQRLGDRLAQEIQDRPIVVHVDMSRVSELEKRVEDLARRLAELETRG